MVYLVSFSSMLDVGKLIQHNRFLQARLRFSSMLDVGKLIQERRPCYKEPCFNSMLNVGKLIPYISDIHFPLSLWYNMEAR